MLARLFNRGDGGEAELIGVLGEFELPSFPTTVMKALSQVRDENMPLTSVGVTLEADPGLSAGLLRLANSAAYSLRHPAQSVAHAVRLLGRSEVESLLLSEGVRRAIPSRPAVAFDPRRFWQASARRAALARAVAQRAHPATASECFTAALLQDMAVPLLARARGVSYGKVLRAWLRGAPSLDRLEREAFGWDHPTVARWMCDAWDLPQGLGQLIDAHHGDPHDLPPAVGAAALLREGEGSEAVDPIVAHLEQVGIASDDAVELLANAMLHGDALARDFA